MPDGRDVADQRDVPEDGGVPDVPPGRGVPDVAEVREPAEVAAGAQRGRRRRRRGLALAGGALVVVLGTAIATGRWLDTGTTSQVAIASDARTAPPVDLPDLRDPASRVTLEAFRGTPVVMNFFASTCVPCRKEMPDFQAVADQLGDRVAFVGIDHQDGRTGALELLAETGVRYPTGYDPRGEVARSYGLLGLPTTVFIGPDGTLLARRTGAMSKNELRDTIERLFPEQA